MYRPSSRLRLNTAREAEHRYWTENLLRPSLVPVTPSSYLVHNPHPTIPTRTTDFWQTTHLAHMKVHFIKLLGCLSHLAATRRDNDHRAHLVTISSVSGAPIPPASSFRELRGDLSLRDPFCQYRWLPSARERETSSVWPGNLSPTHRD